MKTSNTYTHPSLNSEITNHPALYCGTYAKYNNGSIFGKWIDLTLVDSKEELYEICLAIHADESDPELMFQDFQSIDKDLIGESWISDDYFELREIIEKINEMSESELISLNNTYCSETSSGDEIYSNDEEFFNTFFHCRIMDAIRSVDFGTYRLNDDYVKFNGYGNLETFNSFDIDDLPESILTIARYINDNPRLFDL